MSISFRVRLFVVAAFIVATVLTTVMFIGWSQVLAFEVERLDGRLCLEAKGLQSAQWRRDTPRLDAAIANARVEKDIADKFRLPSRTQLMLSIASRNAATNFQSTHWNRDVNFDALPWQSVAASDSLAPPDWAARRDDRPQHADRAQRSEPQPADGCALADFGALGAQWRAARLGSSGEHIIVAVDLAATKNDMNSALRQALVLVVPIALVLTALGAWLLASLTMRPVDRLRDAMKGMSKNALEQRLPVAGEDREFKDLIDTYNTMLARLETSFNQASRFSADAAHELKTPLTILQGRIEQAMNASESGAAALDLMGMQDEVQRLASITRKLLFLSQADAGRMATHRSAVDLTEMLDEIVASAQMVVTDQTIVAQIERGLMLQGDAQLLQQLFNNLISNATRYGRAHGWINVTAAALPLGIEVLFSNASEQIAEAERQRFFERFFRGDPSHHRGTDGSGLGLSLAREIVRAHGGELTLQPSALDEVRLRILWPRTL